MLSDSNQENFTRLWTEAQPSVSRYIASVVRDHSVLKDIVQGTALVLLKKFPDYDPARPFLPWALGVAKFQILGYQRDSARSLVRFDSELLDRYTESWAQVEPEISDEASALKECLKGVSGKSREVVQLRYFEDLASPEIADRLGLKPGNVRVMLQRVREELRQCVERRMRAEGGAS